MSNLAFLNAYQINQRLVDGSIVSQRIGFPTNGCLIQDTTNSPNRSLSSGYNVYSSITVLNSLNINGGPGGNIYYVQETNAQLATVFG